MTAMPPNPQDRRACLDALDDDDLYEYLAGLAAARDEYLEIAERPDGWIAETWNDSGKAARRVAFAAQGHNRRAAMLSLVRKLTC
jgi:hypothetical protein